MDREIHRMDLENFQKLLDKIENKYNLADVNEQTWRNYCYYMGRVLRVVLKELQETTK